MARWTAVVKLEDIESGNQIGETWKEDVEADGLKEAKSRAVNKAWDNVDARLNDVRIVLCEISKEDPSDRLRREDNIQLYVDNQGVGDLVFEARAIEAAFDYASKEKKIQALARLNDILAALVTRRFSDTRTHGIHHVNRMLGELWLKAKNLEV